MGGGDTVSAREVGNGAAHVEDGVEGAGGELELPDGHVRQTLGAVIEVTERRTHPQTYLSSHAATTTDSRYSISSLSGDAKRLAQAIRAHWGIENSLHWVLDIAFREGESRVRKGHGPENLATLRQLTLNLPNRHRLTGCPQTH